MNKLDLVTNLINVWVLNIIIEEEEVILKDILSNFLILNPLHD